MLSTVASCAAPAASAATPARRAFVAPRAAWRLLAGRAGTPGCARGAPAPFHRSTAAPPGAGGAAVRAALAGSRVRMNSFNTAAVALSADRPALADDAEDAPHNRVAAEEYRAQLAREEEAGLFEEADENEERVEVDASAEADDTLAVRAAPPPPLEEVCRRCHATRAHTWLPGICLFGRPVSRRH
jgi:hypothetical protein